MDNFKSDHLSYRHPLVFRACALKTVRAFRDYFAFVARPGTGCAGLGYSPRLLRLSMRNPGECRPTSGLTFELGAASAASAPPF